MPVEPLGGGQLPVEARLLQVRVQLVQEQRGQHRLRVQVPHRAQPQARRHRVEGEFLCPLDGVAEQYFLLI